MPPQAVSALLAVSLPGPHAEAMCNGWCLAASLSNSGHPEALSAPTPL